MNQPSNALSLVGLASAARMSSWGSATRECGRQPMLRASVRASSMYSPREKTATGRQITMDGYEFANNTNLSESVSRTR